MFEIRPPMKLSATINAKAPRNHHTMVIASPVKVRSGRPGTRVREVSHFKLLTSTHGSGMTKIAPTRNNSNRPTKSRISKSIDNDPLSLPVPAPVSAPVLGLAAIPPGMAGGLAAGESRPGISPAFCQPAMPSVQISVSARIMPLAMKSRN